MVVTVTRSKCVCVFLGILLMLVAGSIVALAQTSAGSLAGIVKDSSGAVVPGVEVTARNVGTNESRKATSQADGSFEIIKLQPGNWELKAELSGFKTILTTATVSVGAPTRVELQLEVGQISDVVTVTDVVKLVNTEEGRMSQVVDSKQIDQLPLNGRNPFQLAQLAAGVTPTFNKVAQASSSGDTFQVNGQRHRGNNFLMDGTDNNYAGIGGTPALRPIQDTVQEFRLLTNSFSAEYGRNAGAVVNVITKSGTNQFHGSVYEFLRNDAMDAARIFDSFDSKTGEKSKSPLQQNQFGFTIGGPVIKDKTFFFGAYEGFRQISSTSQSFTVESKQFVDWTLANRPNSIAAKVFKGFPPAQTPDCPTATSPGCTDLGSPAKGVGTFGPKDGIADTGTVSLGNPLLDTLNSYNIRVDHHFNNSANDTVFGRWSHNLEDLPVKNDVRDGVSPAQTIKYMTLTSGWNRVFSPRAVNELRFGWARQAPDAFSTQDKNPSLQFDDGTLQFMSATNIPQFFNRGTYQVSDIYSWTIGNHGMKFGGEYRRNYEDSDFQSLTRGVYLFRNLLDFADDEAYQQQNNLDDKYLPSGTPRSFRQNEMGLFVQDDWKVSSRLTVNLGLRYDLFGVTKEATGKNTNMIFGTGNSVFERLAGGIVNKVDSLYNGDHNNFAPRLGFSWDPTGSGTTAIRGGYGVTYERLFLNLTSNIRFSPPFTFRPTFDVSSAAPANVINYTFPTSLTQAQQDAVKAGFGRLSPTTVEPDIRNIYVHNAFLGVQHQIGKVWVLEANYVGTFGHKLTANDSYSRFFGDRQGRVDPLGRFGGDNSINGLNSKYTATFGTLTDKINQSYHAGQFSITRRFASGLSFSGAYTVSKNIDYDSDPFTATRGSDNAGATDINNLRLDRGLSGIHVGQRFVSSFIYELPFFKSSGGLMSTLLGGWQTNAIVTLQSGTPESLYNSSTAAGADFNGDGNQGDRPNAPAFGNTLTGLTVQDYANPSGGMFATKGATDAASVRALFPTGTAPYLGTLGRNTFLSPNYKNVDFSLYKNFKMPWLGGEKSALQFRAEFYNIFNRVNLQNFENRFTNAALGRSVTSYDPRILQFALRLSF